MHSEVNDGRKKPMWSTLHNHILPEMDCINYPKVDLYSWVYHHNWVRTFYISGNQSVAWSEATATSEKIWDPSNNSSTTDPRIPQRWAKMPSFFSIFSRIFGFYGYEMPTGGFFWFCVELRSTRDLPESTRVAFVDGRFSMDWTSFPVKFSYLGCQKINRSNFEAPFLGLKGLIF